MSQIMFQDIIVCQAEQEFVLTILSVGVFLISY